MSNDGVLMAPVLPGNRHWKTKLKRDAKNPPASPQAATRFVAVQPNQGGFARRRLPELPAVDLQNAKSGPELFQPEDTPRAHALIHTPPGALSEAEEFEPEHHEGFELADMMGPEAAANDGSDGQSPNSILPGTFGMVSGALQKEALIAFRKVYEADAESLEEEKLGKKGTYTKADIRHNKKPDGTYTGTDKVCQRAEPKLGEKIHAWQDAKGKKLQAHFNRLGDSLRKVTGHPRKTGSRYGSSKDGKGLLNQTNQVPNDYTSFMTFDARLMNNGVNQGVENSEPASVAELAPATDGLTAAAMVPSCIDAMFAAESYLRLDSVPEKAKKDLRNFRHAALRFVEDPQNATAEDAEGYLKFMEAYERLFDTTTEDFATVAAAQSRAIRSGTTAAANTLGAGTAITHMVASTNPVTAVAALPLVVGAGVVEVSESRYEYVRRVDQQARAAERSKDMKAVLNSFKTNGKATGPEYELMANVVACFDKQQHRLIRQAKREKPIALLHAFKGGGSIGAALVGVGGLVGMAVAGVLTVATAGAALAVPLLLGAGWGGVLAYRNHKRVRADHTAKWRQRAMQGIALVTPREKLEGLLGAEGTVQYMQEEGEYLPEKGMFAGLRTLEFKPSDNEQWGLHVLALQVQDLANGADYDENSPFMKLIHEGLHIDKLRLMAICKAAEGRKPNDLDFIKAKLAPKIGIKFAVGASQTQAPPHPSIFIAHFKGVLDDLRNAHDVYMGDTRVPAVLQPSQIREKLEALYPDPKAGMQAFHQAITTFLQRTGEPQTEDIKKLKEFNEYLADDLKARAEQAKKAQQDARAAANAKRKHGGLVAKAEDRQRRVAARTKMEADALVTQIEQRAQIGALVQELEYGGPTKLVSARA